MIIKYKLTTQEMKTNKSCQWILNEWKEVDGDGELCSVHKLHYYHHPLLAILLNPIDANIDNPRLWKIECGEEGHLNDNDIKGGCNKERLIEELPVPIFTVDQRIYFALLCVMQIYKNQEWLKWANRWLKNIDRNKDAAAQAAAAAYAAAYSAYASQAAAYAAQVAAVAAQAAQAAQVADYAAQAAAYAAQAAQASASAEALKLIEYAEKAYSWKE